MSINLWALLQLYFNLIAVCSLQDVLIFRSLILLRIILSFYLLIVLCRLAPEDRSVMGGRSFLKGGSTSCEAE